MNPTPRANQLNSRCVLFTLLAMTLAIGMGLLAWGPIPLHSTTHRHAGVSQGIHATLSLLMLACSAWGWRAIARSAWPVAMQRPWRWAFAGIGLSAALAAAYHLAPVAALYHAAQMAGAAGFVLLLCGLLAERVDERFGSHFAIVLALIGVALAAVLSLIEPIDLRPLLLLQWLPVLMLPAGALSLPGHHTTRTDWLLAIGLYALARASDLGNDAVMRLAGQAFSGHALMHLCLSGTVFWLAYRASAAGATESVSDVDVLTQANTSLSTSG